MQVVAAGTNARVYTYSADGHRQQAQVGPTQTFFVWDEENVLQEANASLVTNVAYVQAPGMWGGLIRQQGTQTQAYFGFDFQGSTRLLVRPNGTVVNAYDYKAFGEELQTGSSGSSYRYGGAWGYYRDLPTRLYVRARHLRTDLGRWISRDPIGFAGGEFALYGYIGSNPITAVDPAGLDKCTCQMASEANINTCDKQFALLKKSQWTDINPKDPGYNFNNKRNCPMSRADQKKMIVLCDLDHGIGSPPEAEACLTACCCKNGCIGAITGCSRRLVNGMPKIFQECLWQHEKQRRECCYKTCSCQLNADAHAAFFQWCAWLYLEGCFGRNNVPPDLAQHCKPKERMPAP